MFFFYEIAKVNFFRIFIHNFWASLLMDVVILVFYFILTVFKYLLLYCSARQYRIEYLCPPTIYLSIYESMYVSIYVFICIYLSYSDRQYRLEYRCSPPIQLPIYLSILFRPLILPWTPPSAFHLSIFFRPPISPWTPMSASHLPIYLPATYLLLY